VSFVDPGYFWLFLFLLAAFIKKDLYKLRLTSLGYIFTFVFLVFALARPIIESQPIETQELLSDVVLGVDLSYSMQAEDIAPTRLGFAKRALEEIVRSEQKSRFGVLGFTTNAIILSPLTADSELLLHLFGGLDHRLIMTRGSSVMPALRLARKMSRSKRVSMVLLSDGADELNYESEALFAKENNIIVNVLMIATQIGAPLRLENGALLKDELEEIVVSRENNAIELVANATGGVYTKDVGEILSALESQRDASYANEVTLVQNVELFYLFVAAGVITFLLATTTLKRRVLALLLLFGVSLQGDALERFKDPNAVAFRKGVALYEAGEYERALERFFEVKSSNAEVKSVVFYNIANTLVRLKEFEKAREAYEKSLTLTYSKEADANLRYIKDVREQKDMTTGQQKSKNRSSMAKERESTQKNKEGGGSNMQVSAQSGSGSKDEGKKTHSGAQIDLNAGKAKLSSKQYELINKRQIDEKKPY